MTKSDKSKCADLIIEITSLGFNINISPEEVTISSNLNEFDHSHFSLDKGLLPALRSSLIYAHDRLFDGDE